jgi:hypothetical protein
MEEELKRASNGPQAAEIYISASRVMLVGSRGGVETGPTIRPRRRFVQTSSPPKHLLRYEPVPSKLARQSEG